MDDYISREAALNLIKELHAEAESPEASETLFEAHERIADIPAADVVPVVRCKDCEHQDPDRLDDGAGCFVCRKGHGWKPDDWFCADGVRRE